jgi:hypothetical protein
VEQARTPRQPLAEVFGYPINNTSDEAKRHRQNRLCPYNNKVPSCTKDKASDPLGVCSIFDQDGIVVTCPIRLRQDWLIVEDAAAFFFPPNVHWTSITEVRLNDANAKSAGNIDVVLVSYDDSGRLLDFGSVEVQAVYISGNVRNPFRHYMQDPDHRGTFDWRGKPEYPRPDYLSSSRKRLVPQLIYKGGILSAWNKKQAVVVHSAFFSTLPDLPQVPAEDASIAWMIYDLDHDDAQNKYFLRRNRTAYTAFAPALDKVTNPEPGQVQDFIDLLQSKLDEKLEEPNPPDAPTLTDITGI